MSYSEVRKKCRDKPITSFGLILFYKDVNGNIKFVVQQRRDTFEYMDFIRGLWRSEFQIKSLLRRMTPSERMRIKNYNFQELWDDLFIQPNSKIYTDLYPKAKKKYGYIQHSISNLIDSTDTHVKEQPWGFPKGKKAHPDEPEIECAVRETEEETRIPRSSFDVYPDFKITEEFIGTNSKKYATIYYLAELKHYVRPCRLKTPHCIREDTLSEEVQDMKYETYAKVCILLNNARRENILLNMFNTIKCNFK